MKNLFNRKFIFAAVISAVALAASGCESDENININSKPEVTEAEVISEAKVSEESSEKASAEESKTEAVKETVTEADTEEAEEAAEEKKEVSVNSWIEEYQREIDNYPNRDGEMYELLDISGDGIPELFISGGDYHGAGVTIFTVSDGNVVKLGEYGSFGTVMYDPDKKTVRQGYSGNGHTTGSIFTVENGRVNILVEYDSNGFDDEISYKINGSEVSEEEYNSTLDEYSVDVRLGRKNDVNVKVADASV